MSSGRLVRRAVEVLKRIVIVGASQAGVGAARELRSLGYDQELVLIDPDEEAPFRRPEVSKGLLSGRYRRAAVGGTGMPIGVDRRVPARAVGLDTARQLVQTEVGDLSYDGLIIATGARPRPWPSPVPDRVHSLHGIDDAESFRTALREAKRLVIVGGGFIGLEVAAVAVALGKQVTVLEAAPVVLGRVLGTELGAHVGELHVRHGVALRTEVSVRSFESDPAGRLTGVRLASGEAIPADLALVAIGQQPEVAWLAGSTIPIDGGILCDETTAVLGHDGIVAAGDLASWVNPVYGRRMRIEHWQHAIQHGIYAAKRLLGAHDPAGFSAVPYFWSDQYEGKLQAVGALVGSDESRTVHVDGDMLVTAYARTGRITAFAAYGLGPVILKLASVVRARGSLDDAVQAATSVLDAARSKAAKTGALGVQQ